MVIKLFQIAILLLSVSLIARGVVKLKPARNPDIDRARNRFLALALVLAGLIAGVGTMYWAGLLGEIRGRHSSESRQTDQKPPEDVVRYVEWLTKQGKSVGSAGANEPRENVSLRIEDWGFFGLAKDSASGDSPPGFNDRVALDRSGHAVVAAEQGDWNFMLRADGLDASGALTRVAWLFGACALDPSSTQSSLPEDDPFHDKIKPPILKTDGSGQITFQGWMRLNCTSTKRVTITAKGPVAKLIVEPRDGSTDSPPPNASRGGNVAISGGVLNGSALTLPPAVYPEAARAKGIEGQVEVEVLVNEDGKVIKASAVSGPPQLQEESVKAAYGAEFPPKLLAGKTVSVRGVIVYHFRSQ